MFKEFSGGIVHTKSIPDEASAGNYFIEPPTNELLPINNNTYDSNRLEKTLVLSSSTLNQQLSATPQHMAPVTDTASSSHDPLRRSTMELKVRREQWNCRFAPLQRSKMKNLHSNLPRREKIESNEAKPSIAKRAQSFPATHGFLRQDQCAKYPDNQIGI